MTQQMTITDFERSNEILNLSLCVLHILHFSALLSALSPLSPHSRVNRGLGGRKEQPALSIHTEWIQPGEQEHHWGGICNTEHSGGRQDDKSSDLGYGRTGALQSHNLCVSAVFVCSRQLHPSPNTPLCGEMLQQSSHNGNSIPRSRSFKNMANLGWLSFQLQKVEMNKAINHSEATQGHRAPFELWSHLLSTKWLVTVKCYI